MERFNWEVYEGKKVLRQDFSGLSKPELLEVLAQSHEKILASGIKDIYVLTNISGVTFDRKVTKQLEYIASLNKPYVKDSAVYGVGTIQKVALEAIGKLSGRHFTLFIDEDSARTWLYQNKSNE